MPRFELREIQQRIMDHLGNADDPQVLAALARDVLQVEISQDGGKYILGGPQHVRQLDRYGLLRYLGRQVRHCDPSALAPVVERLFGVCCEFTPLTLQGQGLHFEVRPTSDYSGLLGPLQEISRLKGRELMSILAESLGSRALSRKSVTPEAGENGQCDVGPTL